MSRPLLTDLCKEMKVPSIPLRRSDAARAGSLSLLRVSFSATDQIEHKNACCPDGGHSQNPSKKSRMTGCTILSVQNDLASICLISVCGYIKAEYAEQSEPQHWASAKTVIKNPASVQ